MRTYHNPAEVSLQQVLVELIPEGRVVVREVLQSKVLPRHSVILHGEGFCQVGTGLDICTENTTGYGTIV